jgi:ComF family protein
VEFFDSGLLGFRACVFMYRGKAAEAVQSLKYGRKTSLIPWMAERVAAAPGSFGLEYDVVVPVPIHWSRRAARGFNQAEELAKDLTFRIDLLARVKRTRSQVGLSRAERLKNLSGAFEASPKVGGLSVLLVDDVLTSGQTARECASALLRSGAKEVGVLCFAGEAFHD